ILVLTLATTVFVLWREKLFAEQALSDLSEEQKRTKMEKDLANEEHGRAEREKKIAQAVLHFLRYKLLGQANIEQQAFNLFDSGRPSAEAKRNPTIRELLDRAAAELTPELIDVNFREEPYVQAQLLDTIGETYWGLGEYPQAIAHSKRSLALLE